MELTCLIKTGHVGYDPISAAMNDSKRLSDNPRYDKIRKTLPKRLLPKPDRRMKLSLSCGFFTELPVNQSWHDFDPVEIAEKPKSGKLVAHYPVSEKSEHVMSKQGYEFFYHPVRWNETGRRCAKMINVMAGNRTYGEIAKQKNMDPAVVKEKFEYVEPICLQLIETDVKSMIAGKHEKFTSICDDLQCPVYVRGFFLRPVLSSIKYFGNRGAYYNPERRGFAQNIVDYVNSRLTANRKPTITVEQFCGVY